MNRSFLQLGYSGWWVLLIILVSLAVSYYLYSKKNIPWTKGQNWFLFAIRSLATFLILLLLLDPVINKVVNTIKPPTIAVAIDNSESIIARGDDQSEITNNINSLVESLQEQDINIQLFVLSDELDTIQFNHRTSNLSSMLSSIDDELEEENFAATILLTDGIYNRGLSPVYRNYIAPIFTVGMGDSLAPKDIGFSRVLYNKVTYKGNESPIKLEVSQQGFDGREVTISLSEKGKRLDSQSVRLNEEVQEFEFILSSEEEGLRHLIASIPSNPNESTIENNQIDIFLEVIDGRQKVLFVANAPHPDINALRSTLASTDNYTTDLYIPSMDTEKPTEIYDVVVFHGAFSSGINFVPKENPGIWYILSSESAINSVNRALPFLRIDRRGGQPDKVTGSFNQNFSKFKIENDEIFEEYPPIEVPFGEYTTSGPSEILMYQKLGSVVTRKPLMVFYDDGSSKSAVLMGQNIWRWKLQEAAINDNATQFQNFVTKTIQFLSVKNDKKQFRFTPRTNTINDSSPILFDVEVYNDIYERIYGNTITITITNEEGDQQQYDFTDSEVNSTFRAPGLEPGVYSFSARTNIGEERFTDTGEFLVVNVNPEYLNLTANHRLLRNLAENTGGEFVHLSQIDRLPEIINQRDFKSIIESDEDYQELAKSWWWYLIIFLLFSTEWVLRRYWGGY